MASEKVDYLKSPMALTLPKLFQWLTQLPAWRKAVAARVLLVLLALCAVFLFARAFANVSTLWAAVTFLLLVLMGREQGPESAPLPSLGVTRLVAFAAAMGATIWVANSHAGALKEAAATYSLEATLRVSVKFLPLLAGLILFPLSTWRSLAKRLRAELLAALVVLVTFFPFRLMTMVWPAYSDYLAFLVYQTNLPWLPHLYYIPGTDPILVGPKMALQLVFYCSGIDGIYLFDILFWLVVILEWNELRKGRALLCYFLGLGFILATNLLRLILLNLAGNLISPRLLDLGLHQHVGWVLFGLAFVAFLWVTYRWMRKKPGGTGPDGPSSLEPQPASEQPSGVQ